jgi:hypothetical protein
MRPGDLEKWRVGVFGVLEASGDKGSLFFVLGGGVPAFDGEKRGDGGAPNPFG